MKANVQATTDAPPPGGGQREATDQNLPLLTVDRAATVGRMRRKSLIFSILAALVLGGTLWMTQRNSAAQVPAPALVSDRVHALGRLEPEGEVLLIAAPGSAGDARILTLEVAEGDAVRAGDPLAVLDSVARLEAGLIVAESDAALAHASLVEARADVASQRARLSSALRAAEADLAQAEIHASRYGKLANISAVSAEMSEDFQLKRVIAAEAVTQARADVERFGSGPLEESPSVVVARQEFQAAQAAVRQATAQLADARILAPADGTVLRVVARPGERIGSDPLLEMGNTRRMMARVEVYESEVPGLRSGQPAVLSASPLPHPLRGEIIRISSLVRKQEIIEANPAANTDARVIEVWVMLDPESSQTASRFVNLQVRVAFEP